MSWKNTIAYTCIFLAFTTILEGKCSSQPLKWTSNHARHFLNIVETVLENEVHTRTFTRLTLSVRRVVSPVGTRTLHKRPPRQFQRLRRKKRDVVDDLTYSILQYGGKETLGAHSSRAVLRSTPDSSIQETSTRGHHGSRPEDSKYEKKRDSGAAAITIVVVVTLLLKVIGVTLFCKHILVRYNNKKYERQKKAALERIQRAQNELMQSYIAANNMHHKKELEKALSALSQKTTKTREPELRINDKIVHSSSMDKLPGPQLVGHILNRAEAWRSLDGLVRLSDQTLEESSPPRPSHTYEPHPKERRLSLCPGDAESSGLVFQADDPTVPLVPPRRRSWTLFSNFKESIKGDRQKYVPLRQPSRVHVDGLGNDQFPQVCIQRPKKTQKQGSVWPVSDSDTSKNSQPVTAELLDKCIQETQPCIPAAVVWPSQTAVEEGILLPIPIISLQAPQSMTAFSSQSAKEQLTGQPINSNSSVKVRRHSAPFQGKYMLCRDDTVKSGFGPYTASCVVSAENEPKGMCHATKETCKSRDPSVVMSHGPAPVPPIPPPRPTYISWRQGAPFASLWLSGEGVGLSYMMDKSCSRL